LPEKVPNFVSEELPLVYVPRSPASLAIATILALVPHPKDPNPSAAESVLLRRLYANKFAQLAMESVEAETELVESGINPSEALQNEKPTPDRLPLHQYTPVELESILALLILSVYEYAQRGNIVKMRHRAGQAYVIAMNMSLHSLGPEEDPFSEARRRAWWMTVWRSHPITTGMWSQLTVIWQYYAVCQGSIVSTTVRFSTLN
jgi:hypothetical protein